MDPNAALANLREAIADYGSASTRDSDTADRIVETFEALDGWLSKGGFLPADWESGYDKAMRS